MLIGSLIATVVLTLVILLTVHVTGGSATVRFDSLEQARARLQEDVPTWPLTVGVLAHNGHAALFHCPERQCIALAQAHGFGFFTRFITAGTLRRYTLGDEGVLHLVLDDFTSPLVSMVLPATEVPVWRTRLIALHRSND